MAETRACRSHRSHRQGAMWEQLDIVDARFEEDPHVVPISHGDVCEEGLDSLSGKASGRNVTLLGNGEFGKFVLLPMVQLHRDKFARRVRRFLTRQEDAVDRRSSQQDLAFVSGGSNERNEDRFGQKGQVSRVRQPGISRATTTTAGVTHAPRSVAVRPRTWSLISRCSPNARAERVLAQVLVVAVLR